MPGAATVGEGEAVSRSGMGGGPRERSGTLGGSVGRLGLAFCEGGVRVKK